MAAVGIISFNRAEGVKCQYKARMGGINVSEIKANFLFVYWS